MHSEEFRGVVELNPLSREGEIHVIIALAERGSYPCTSIRNRAQRRYCKECSAKDRERDNQTKEGTWQDQSRAHKGKYIFRFPWSFTQYLDV